MFTPFDIIRFSLFFVFFYFFDASVWFVPRSTITKKATRTVLIVRPDSIGDFIVWLDTAKEMRRIYPPQGYRITLLANQECAEGAPLLG